MAVDKLHSVSEPLLSNGGCSEKERKTCFFVQLAKWVLKSSMLILFTAWVVLFFLVPSSFGTSLYDDWVAATSGTLFGETGSVLLLYNGPLIIITLLAVPYLIICRGEQDEELREKKAPRFSLWTFPVLVDGPFGVVSAAELIGILLFVVFVLWAVFAYTDVNFEMLPSYGDLTSEEKRVFMLQMSAYCFGLIALSCLAFLLLPITRGSILLRLIDIPFEHATKYHIWLGHLIMFLVTLHGLCYMIVWAIRRIIPTEIIEWKTDGGANFAGVICYVFGLLIWVTTLPPIRKRYFELFFYAHQLYILFIIFLALHIGDTNFSKASGGIFLFMVDRFLRFCQSRKAVNVISTTCFPCGTVKLVLSKPRNLKYNALSFIFLQVRQMSWLQWHPFSVSSSPLDGEYHLSVLIKSVGDWTESLRGKVSEILAEESKTMLPYQSPSQIIASVEGPYGHESPYHLMYEKLILIAGGSGISPFIAILSDIVHRVGKNKPCIPRNILLVWAVKRSDELSILSTFDMESIRPSFSDQLKIEIQIYVTRESEPTLDGKVNHIPKSSLNFSKTKEMRMSVLVGTGSKIWSGSYVVLCVIGFAVSLGLLDQFYINPFSISYWWYKGLLFVACMVISVFIFGGLAVGLWHFWERRNADYEEVEEDEENINLIHHSKVVLENDDNARRGTISSSSSILYGCRPDFREIFGSTIEQWGHVNVGVIVCGLPSLQSSVARECRSQNLRRSGCHPIFHFNSHSFDL